MVTNCFRYNWITKQFSSITVWDLIRMKKENYQEFLEVTKNALYKYPMLNEKYKMTFYLNVDNPHFKMRAVSDLGSQVYLRSENESLTHLINKIAISRLNELHLVINDEKVTIFVSNGECESRVTCNGTPYEVDIRFKVDRTVPIEYKERIGEYLNFEIYHSHPVDWQKAKDFRIQNESMFEFKVWNKVKDYLIKSEEDLECEIEKKIEYYKSKELWGIMVCDKRNKSFLKWKENEKGNSTSFSKETRTSFTIFQDKDGQLKLVYSGPATDNKSNFMNKMDGKSFLDLQQVQDVADYIAFCIYNNFKIKKD